MERVGGPCRAVDVAFDGGRGGVRMRRCGGCWRGWRERGRTLKSSGVRRVDKTHSKKRVRTNLIDHPAANSRGLGLPESLWRRVCGATNSRHQLATLSWTASEVVHVRDASVVCSHGSALRHVRHPCRGGRPRHRHRAGAAGNSPPPSGLLPANQQTTHDRLPLTVAAENARHSTSPDAHAPAAPRDNHSCHCQTGGGLGPNTYARC